MPERPASKKPAKKPAKKPNWQPKDYIRTQDDLFLAVLRAQSEQGRAIAWLRYRRDPDRQFRKLSEEDACATLRRRHPEYLWHSRHADAITHAVPHDDIAETFRPQDRLAAMLREHDLERHADPKQRAACEFVSLLRERGVHPGHLGISGSLLIGAQHARSDIDLVVYGREEFFRTLEAVRELREQGLAQALRPEEWRETWRRRDCELKLPDYVWHEQRKGNKVTLHGSRIDLSLCPLPAEAAPESVSESGGWRKRGTLRLCATVIDDRFRYDCPSRYRIDHPEVAELVCYTASYTAQARTGERIEAAGYLEENEDGQRQLLIGSSRSAKGEYIKVLEPGKAEPATD